MNRRRTQPARPNKPEETSPSTPANASVAAFDEELAQAFFQAGQSEEALVAASERQSETELSANRTRGSARFIYGAAALGIAAAALLYLIPKGIDQAPASAASALVAPTATTTTATTTTTTTEPAPAAVAPPVPSVPVVAANNDPAASEPPSEGGGPAAPPSNAALATATNTSNTLAAAVVVPPTPEQSASETGASSATAAPIVSVRDLRARTADPAPTTDTVSSTNTTAPPPSDLMAEAAPPSAAETAKDACTKLLRRGKFSDIKVSCGRAFTAEPSAALAVQVARHALEHERYNDAQTWSRKAIELDEGHSEAFVTLGGAEHGLGHRTLARNAYARYLELEPQGPYADDVRALIDSL